MERRGNERSHGARHDGRHDKCAARIGVAATLLVAVVLGAVFVVAVFVVTGPGPTSAATPATALDTATTSALMPVGPIRLADTRRSDCGCRRRDTRTITVDVTAHPDVPTDAVAAALTVTALRTAAPGFVTAFPSGSALPDTSTVNTRPDRVVANTTIVPIGDDGQIVVHLSDPTDVVVDLTAVFRPATSSRAGRFVPIAGQRLVDTRAAAPLRPGARLDVPLPNAVSRDATAVVVNLTSVRADRPGHLAARAADSAPSGTSVLNPDGSGAAVAGATIVPVGPGGFSVDVASGGHVVVDLLGWFTGPSAVESDSGLFVPMPPRRVLDTRTRPGRLHRHGTIEMASPVPNAAALVTNVTAVRPDHRGFITAYPAGRSVPATSTVNPPAWNHTVSNLAITQTSERGIAYRSSAGTDLLVDVTGWFTGGPLAATEPPAPNRPGRARVLLVGDSTLASLDLFTEARAAFVGFDAVVDAGQCRRLLRPSCRSSTTGLVPSTAVEAIGAARGDFDVVVVKAGYNDWFSDFPAEFDAVVRAARAKGAHTILWLSYNEDVARPNARRAYQENNADLRWLAALPQYGDVLLADWLRYSGQRRSWFVDGTHLTRDGTWALADYVGRWVAAVEHRPCPRPWSNGLRAPDPCPPPELVGSVSDPRSLY